MTVLKDVFLYIDGYDFRPVSSTVSLSSEKELVQSTVFGSEGDAHEYEKGLEQTTAEIGGKWGAGTTGVDSELWADLAGDDERVYSLGEAEVETAIAWSFRANRTNYMVGGEIGILAPFTANAQGRSKLLRGQLALKKTTVTGTGPAGSVVNLGAVSASQHVYAVLHAFGTPGSSVTVQVQSDSDGTFATPTTRGTIGPQTTSGAVSLTPVAGSITDTHWRLNVSAVSGTWQLAGFLAVQ